MPSSKPFRVPQEQRCIKCGAPLQLARIDPDRRGWELHMFECTKCGAPEAHVIKK
jgi:hypothetical protein